MFYNLLKNLLKAAITLAKHFLPRHAGGILGHFAISSGLRQATEKKKKKGCFFFLLSTTVPAKLTSPSVSLVSFSLSLIFSCVLLLTK